MSTLAGIDVSRETIERLETYERALKKWNPRINLVAKSTMEVLWSRHFADSAQLLHLVPPSMTKWADFGSGGGFPGLVIAILAAEMRHGVSVTLVESDHRKCAFLRHVIRETEISANVMSKRIEDVPVLKANVITARALADLSKLLSLSHRHLAEGGVMLFQKGKNWEAELIDAQSKWYFDHEVANSKTSDQSVILSISGVCRA